jgi:hypothetical protein
MTPDKPERLVETRGKFSHVVHIENVFLHKIHVYCSQLTTAPFYSCNI